MKHIILFVLSIMLFFFPVSAKPIEWVDFSVPAESLRYAMDMDIQSAGKENHLNWISILAVDACLTGGKCPLKSVQNVSEKLVNGQSPEEILGDLMKYYPYYSEAYSAVLGGLLGHFAIQKDGQWHPIYGLKAFSPIADGYGYQHYEDFGANRSFGFKRKHLGNDLLGAAGTPIVAVEGGTIEALGWNRYGGWRVGIRSHDRKRYYYYAHLRKDSPFAPELKVGKNVQAGDLIGFMGRTGYSDTENVNNIEIDHLHLGMQLIFDESQKDCNSEIWINVYPIVQLLSTHRSSLCKSGGNWSRYYPYQDLDLTPLRTQTEPTEPLLQP